MHRIDNSKYLLYIEPKKEDKSENPTVDDITKKVELLLSQSKKGAARYSNLESEGEFEEGNAWRGIHGTECGERSDNKDYLLPNGMITNSLCVFYLKYYRSSIPETEMLKVKQLCEWEA